VNIREVIDVGSAEENLMARKYRIAVLPGDGIGQEVMRVAIEILEKVSSIVETFSLDFRHFPWCSRDYLQTGVYIPDGGLEELKALDAILFGAVGAPGNLLPSLIDMILT
jgi:isocitrate/isopropylmalate dehydrogenase